MAYLPCTPIAKALPRGNTYPMGLLKGREDSPLKDLISHRRVGSARTGKTGPMTLTCPRAVTHRIQVRYGRSVGYDAR